MNLLHMKITDNPLIANVTNQVAANFCANALLAVGASPIVTSSSREVVEIVRACDALVINVGTLASHQFGTMESAARMAQRLGKPWVLDPAGAAASAFRLDCCRSLILNYKPAVIRGNASEIKALQKGRLCASKGVDSAIGSDEAREYAQRLASLTGAVVIVSGETDFITDGKESRIVSAGSPMMKKVTALGCVSSALVAAFLCACKNRLEAGTFAMTLMGECGQKAASLAKGPGSFVPAFIDELYIRSCNEA